VRAALETTVSRVNAGTDRSRVESFYGAIIDLYREKHLPDLEHSTRQTNTYLLNPGKPLNRRTPCPKTSRTRSAVKFYASPPASSDQEISYNDFGFRVTKEEWIKNSGQRQGNGNPSWWVFDPAIAGGKVMEKPSTAPMKALLPFSISPYTELA
jgi:hypothetical protein